MTEQIYVGSVFAAGVLSFFSPCILPLLPVYLAFLGSSETGNRFNSWQLWRMKLSPVLIIRTLLFILGLSMVFVVLGFGAGSLGTVLNSSLFITICGIIVILFGIYQTGIFKLKFLEREKKLSADFQKNRGFFGAFLLGFTFSFGWTPCIGPVLAAVLSLSASGGSVASGGIYMLVYALGLAIPFFVMALFSDLLLTKMRKLYKHMNALKIVSSAVLILMGILLVTNKLNDITSYFQY
ncbi:cytochrome C biogenesis protein CcdA [Pullulanibacillus camelliae]|uniref:Cytochrome C biogenesis protein CcdA n=1 Tax=Pullulanibacillus camelliae TaxID=1707096 RepID=A0A8J2VIP1_9BACL|nr:cytochrome c biogenesis protein CcdA [Pullulanibacillus camelliae]GGE30985.1 cytochrome C biogenesis protein CcdA [Pullulanibacillus camelliae]